MDDEKEFNEEEAEFDPDALDEEDDFEVAGDDDLATEEGEEDPFSMGFHEVDSGFEQEEGETF